ncbi:hypothetical protein C4N9_03110 [Pararhodobacter marinus]|uniref:DUF418 domain-containing protein n=1 Tax=Pararhodobacter marinus TaxID=2184063 RepID=A0A2U2CFY4_9RHOB|nr:DUF418 domain-containing protein [Pararhodobacter marinus]PWE30762.1 hypothetical protein C4N9_03110 [Pararhodobacter marinus]
MLGPERNTAVDLIRLLALVGICVVNVPFLALPVETTLAAPETLPDRLAVFAVEALFQSKFFLLFSFLFGWGLHVQEASARRSGASFGGRYGRRLGALALMGCLHAVLVFTGDILLIYALLGLLIWPFLGLGPRALVRLAGAMIPLAAISLLGLSVMLTEVTLPVEGAGLGGGFIEATRARLHDWPETLGFLLLFQGPLAFGAFALGLAAGKSDFFSPDSPGRRALRRAVPGLAVAGIPINALYAASMGGLIPPEQELLSLAGFVGIALGGPMLSAVYLHLMLGLADRLRLPGILQAAGRNSLSVYVLQGIVAGFVFGAYGLGLFDRIGWAGLVPVSLLVAALAILAVGLIARRSGRGPLEIVLRRVTYAGKTRPRPQAAHPGDAL